jgi:hypothetical protein
MTGGTRQFQKPLLIDTLRLVARAKEDERLRALVLSGISIDAIAALMKRSATAVRNRAARLSIVVANLRRFSHFLRRIRPRFSASMPPRRQGLFADD